MSKRKRAKREKETKEEEIIVVHETVLGARSRIWSIGLKNSLVRAIRKKKNMEDTMKTHYVIFPKIKRKKVKENL